MGAEAGESRNGAGLMQPGREPIGGAAAEKIPRRGFELERNKTRVMRRRG